MSDPGMTYAAGLSERYDRVKAALPPHVRLVAVSKTRSVEEVQALYALGQRDFGENYPQELKTKQPLLPADIRWHFIGHLQTNKVKMIAGFVHLVHAVDSQRLLDELDKRAEAAGRRIGVLLQRHIAREESKHGLDEAKLEAILVLREQGAWPHLDFQGMMGMATLTEDLGQVQQEFEGLAETYRTLPLKYPRACAGFDTLSMGMSDDAPIAVEAGSNMVRIGTAIFGPRGA